MEDTRRVATGHRAFGCGPRGDRPSARMAEVLHLGRGPTPRTLDRLPHDPTRRALPVLVLLVHSVREQQLPAPPSHVVHRRRMGETAAVVSREVKRPKTSSCGRLAFHVAGRGTWSITSNPLLRAAKTSRQICSGRPSRKRRPRTGSNAVDASAEPRLSGREVGLQR